MPPKKKQGGGGSNDKAKKKIIEDKTFGLKNKKRSAKVNRYVQQVEQQVLSAGNRKQKKEAEDRKQAQLSKKEAEAQKKAELAELFKPVQQQQKVPFGVNPSTVLCAFFKQGSCQKGAKCKFSHDIKIERKDVKIDLYTDKRNDQKSDTMDAWDQAKLEKVVTSKHGNPKTTTDIVCKYFLEAIENQKYGWFWECPNGGDKCKYRHALPPGFVLKTKKEKLAESEKVEISLEEFLETERHKLGPNLTPVTLESFTAWKKNRKAKLEAEETATQKAKEAAFKAGRAVNISGRDFFQYNPDTINNEGDDEGDVFDVKQYRRDDDDTVAENGIQSPPVEQLGNKLASTQLSA
ncbi:Translation machinery-associated protein 46 [Dispira parvispora]|uniref:Translation machinery-associated protein 46 n=1 Tax=Dispira parvispora TaxID=1520584 RepID=A0A9W8AZG7_9FUNG|nr:Translation machinery-associated protein 46 [Dispira parvispora]